jgi:putative secretion ATPase (PEP-CTERM system associated)
MLNDHYGLSGRPFQLTPDSRFWFESATHAKAMAYLGYGLAQGEGFVIVTGEIGAGKTTLTGHLLETVDPARVNAIRITSSQLSGEDLLRMVAAGLGLSSAVPGKGDLLDQIETGLLDRARNGQKTLLIVDEAQNLPLTALEELRMLSNIQAGEHSLVQIFMLGQPEFRDRLSASPELEQLRQRVIATHHLTAMEEHEVRPYVEHRMKLVGWQGNPAFAEDVWVAIHAYSQGLPRRVNNLMTRVLLAGSMDQLPVIDAALVNAVVADLSRDEEAGADTARMADMSAVRASGSGYMHESQALDQAARIAMLEAQVEEQGTALRRVLTLLIDWAESDIDPKSQSSDFYRAPAA